MIWLVVLGALFFSWIAISMYWAAYKETDAEMRQQLLRKGFGPLVLALMGFFFAYYAWHPPEPAPQVQETRP